MERLDKLIKLDLHYLEDFCRDSVLFPRYKYLISRIGIFLTVSLISKNLTEKKICRRMRIIQLIVHELEQGGYSENTTRRWFLKTNEYLDKNSPMDLIENWEPDGIRCVVFVAKSYKYGVMKDSLDIIIK